MKRINLFFVLFALILALFTSCAPRPEVGNIKLKEICLEKKFQIKVESRVNDDDWPFWTCRDENITFFADSIHVAVDNSYLEIFNYITKKGLEGKK